MAKFIINFGLIISLSFAIIGILADNEVGDGEVIRMFGGVKVYKMEKPCATVGGLCVQKNECVQEPINSGLCPDNQHNGVECCYRVNTKPAPCAQHLGECMNRCHQSLHRPGTDCPNGQVCCLLV